MALIKALNKEPVSYTHLSEFYQVIYAVLRSFPLFPNAHAQSATNSCVHLFTKCFHTT